MPVLLLILFFFWSRDTAAYPFRAIHPVRQPSITLSSNGIQLAHALDPILLIWETGNRKATKSGERKTRQEVEELLKLFASPQALTYDINNQQVSRLPNIRRGYGPSIPLDKKRLRIDSVLVSDASYFKYVDDKPKSAPFAPFVEHEASSYVTRLPGENFQTTPAAASGAFMVAAIADEHLEKARHKRSDAAYDYSLDAIGDGATLNSKGTMVAFKVLLPGNQMAWKRRPMLGGWPGPGFRMHIPVETRTPQSPVYHIQYGDTLTLALPEITMGQEWTIVLGRSYMEGGPEGRDFREAPEIVATFAMPSASLEYPCIVLLAWETAGPALALILKKEQ